MVVDSLLFNIMLTGYFPVITKIMYLFKKASIWKLTDASVTNKIVEVTKVCSILEIALNDNLAKLEMHSILINHHWFNSWKISFSN